MEPRQPGEEPSIHLTRPSSFSAIKKHVPLGKSFLTACLSSRNRRRPLGFLIDPAGRRHRQKTKLKHHVSAFVPARVKTRVPGTTRQHADRFTTASHETARSRVSYLHHSCPRRAFEARERLFTHRLTRAEALRVTRLAMGTVAANHVGTCPRKGRMCGYVPGSRHGIVSARSFASRFQPTKTEAWLTLSPHVMHSRSGSVFCRTLR